MQIAIYCHCLYITVLLLFAFNLNVCNECMGHDLKLKHQTDDNAIMQN